MLRRLLLIVVFVPLILTSCGKAASQPEPSFEPIDENTSLFLIAMNGKWGYIDQTGKVRIEPQFDHATAFEEGVASVYFNHVCFLIDCKGVVFHDPDIQLGIISEGLVVANNEGGRGKTGFITTDGEPAISFKFDMALGFSEGLALVHVDKKVGYIDKTGDLVIPPIFGRLSYNFHNGLAKVVIPSGKHKGFTFVNNKGEVVFDTSYDYAEGFSDGLAGVLDYDDPNGTQKYITTDGEVAFYLESIYHADCFSDGLLLCFNTTDATKLFVDTDGRPAFENNFKDAHLFSESMAAVLIGDKWGYINKAGDVVIKPQWNWAYEFRNGLAKVVLGDGWAYIDKNGEYVWGPESHGFKW